MVDQKVIPLGEEFSIAIIGGGIAGVTFAAAALKSNISVTLFEREAEYLHMQQGCDTRKIHPNIYDWPDVGSTFPNARLPVLSWTYNTASNVAEQIIDGLSDISKRIEDSEHERAPALFNEYKNCQIEAIHDKTAKTNQKFMIVHGSPIINSYVDLIIYAVGFGVEKDVEGADAPPYWRNDALAQSVLTNARRFMVSGVGDGALVDLCRIKLRNFSYDKILALLKSNTRKYDKLLYRLRDIKKRGMAAGKTIKPDFYHMEFELIEENYYKYFLDALEKDIVKLNTVTFNGRREEECALDFSKVSMLNAFIVYLLKRYHHLHYKKGELTYKSGKYFIDDSELDQVDQFVIRHGTDISPITNGMYLNTIEQKKLQELKGQQEATGPDENYWSFESISACFIDGSANPQQTVLRYNKRSEYVTPDTRALCLPFVTMLSQMLGRLPNCPKHYRLALHRVTQFDKKYYFQQITPYNGSKIADDSGCFGNVYPVAHGIVGHVVNSGKAAVVNVGGDESYEQLKNCLSLDKVRDHEIIPRSFLAIPVMAKLKTGELAVNLVFYMDTDDPDFFNDREIFELVLSAMGGMVGYIEQMISEGSMDMSETEFNPLPVKTKWNETISGNPCFIEIENDKSLYPQDTNLMFKEFYSFDMIYLH